MPNQMSDSRDGGPTFFMRQFGLFHTYRTVLQPGHVFRREPLSLSKGRSTSCGYAAYLVTCVVFGEKMLNYAVGFLWKKENIQMTIRYFTASGMMVNVVQHQQSPDCRFFEKNGKKLIF